MIDRKRRVVIVHMPKCAGSSVQAALGIPAKGYGAPRHGTIEQIYKHNPYCRKWPVYLLVRNPFTRLVSHHTFVNYQVRVLGYRYPSSTKLVPLILDTGLQTFLDTTDWNDWLRIGKVDKYSHFHTNSDMGKIKGVYQERITPIYFETLEHDMKMHFGLKVPHLNAGPKSGPIWTLENVARIVDAFREDFDRFGYKLVPEDI